MGLRLYRSALWQVLCLLLVVFGVVVPCLLLLVAINVDTSQSEAESSLARSLSSHERKPLDYPADPREASELRQQIRELEDIRSSVRDELRVFEQQRSKLSADIAAHKESLARVKKELAAANKDLQDKRGKLSKVNRDLYDRVDPAAPPAANLAPIIVLPAENKMSSLSDISLPRGQTVDDSQFSRCTFDLCFNLARCPLTRPFSVYVYNEINPYLFPMGRHGNLVSDFVAGLKGVGSYTSESGEACLFVVVMENRDGDVARDVQSVIHSLPHWGGEGANHLLVELSTTRDTASLLDGVSTGRAIVSRSIISPSKPFRSRFDILLPPLPTAEVSRRDLPSLLPVSRDNLLYFHGEYVPPTGPAHSSLSPADIKKLQQALEGREKVDIELRCPESGAVGGTEGEWMVCGGQSSRVDLCSRSLFSLVPSPRGPGSKLRVSLYTRLIESLICGSIPILVGVGTLPFDDVIDWGRASISVPAGRFSEIHYILRSVSREDVQNLRLQGRNLWHTYFSSPLSVVQSTVAMVRSWTLHPPPLAPEFSGVSLLSRPTSRHKRISSPSLSHNFTTYSWGFWNSLPGPLLSYPSTPFKPGPLSGSQFSELDEGGLSRLPLHIVDGGGITGPNFEDLLLGNSPEEQFTVVMLTYQRNRVLVEALARLGEVAFLNKVVVVWNNEEAPPTELEWPDIGVPIEVVRGRGNSLNNRFLPFREIDTEAVLSIDDDVHLRADEIQFAFRVWREARDRIVGFPGRFHAYDLKHGSWLYNSNYTCELSMVLTGAAFFHKIYSYLYSYWQPKEVREMVDQYMNCEDIAMNFLVSHVTRKPPLKVTSRWTFRCPGCPDTLSTDDTHFQERHVCMKYLTGLYGYMPLLYTQFRVDSVLFKTRLPSTLQKCYQFI